MPFKLDPAKEEISTPPCATDGHRAGPQDPRPRRRRRPRVPPAHDVRPVRRALLAAGVRPLRGGTVSATRAARFRPARADAAPSRISSVPVGRQGGDLQD